MRLLLFFCMISSLFAQSSHLFDRWHSLTPSLKMGYINRVGSGSEISVKYDREQAVNEYTFHGIPFKYLSFYYSGSLIFDRDHKDPIAIPQQEIGLYKSWDNHSLLSGFLYDIRYYNSEYEDSWYESVDGSSKQDILDLSFVMSYEYAFNKNRSFLAGITLGNQFRDGISVESRTEHQGFTAIRYEEKSPADFNWEGEVALGYSMTLFPNFYPFQLLPQLFGRYSHSQSDAERKNEIIDFYKKNGNVSVVQFGSYSFSSHAVGWSFSLSQYPSQKLARPLFSIDYLAFGGEWLYKKGKNGYDNYWYRKQEWGETVRPYRQNRFPVWWGAQVRSHLGSYFYALMATKMNMRWYYYGERVRYNLFAHGIKMGFGIRQDIRRVTIDFVWIREILFDWGDSRDIYSAILYF